MRHYCTFFDSTYLTRGLALYHSLKRHSGEFRLDILCLDEECLDRLTRLSLPGCRLISLPQMEAADAALAATKSSRSKVEYYFTTTPCFIAHLLKDTPKGELLTYLDADIYFYADPEPVFDELKNASIGIIEHRFAPDQEHMKMHGVYNVGWITVRNNADARLCIDIWRESCLEWCYDRIEEGRYADQAYLNDWPDRFANTVVIKHLGANLAPWNVGQYEIAVENSVVTVNGQRLIFYHFHALRGITDHLFDSQLSNYGIDVTRELRQYIYKPYLDELWGMDQKLSALLPPDSQPSTISSKPCFDLIPRKSGPNSTASNEQAKIEDYLYQKLVLVEKGRAAKEAIILDLKKACNERDAAIYSLDLECRRLRTYHTTFSALPAKILHFFPRLGNSIRKRTIDRLVQKCGMQPGILRQHEPRKMQVEKFPKPSLPESALPPIAMVTPSYMQGCYLERTMRSILSQEYPGLHYVVQDGGSTDDSAEIIKRHESKLAAWESAPDNGQSAAVKRGFEKSKGEIMAWLNSDDLLMPGALRYIGEYLATHPSVDAIYGHRVVIDNNDEEVGRWVLPRHDDEMLKWADYVPQETLFWRRALWDKVGGVDPSFRFALDWDLLSRFQKAGARIVRLPYFLGCFRIHPKQKTSAEMVNSTGELEMARIRKNIHDRVIAPHELEPHVIRYCRKSATTAWLLSKGIRT